MFDPFKPGQKYPVEEYLRLENMSEVKHEFRDGVVYEVGSPPPPLPIKEARDVFSKLTERIVSLVGRLDLAIEVADGPEEEGATILVKRTPDGDVSNRDQQLTDPSCVILLTSDFSYVTTFRDGEIILISGSSMPHSRIIANVIRQLGNRLDGSPCAVFDSNLRIQIARKRLYSYGDVTVICGEPILSDVEGIGPTYTNPRLMVEVLAPSTRKFNEQGKFDRFRELATFEEYVLVEQDEPRVETRYRHPDGHWAIDFAIGLESSIVLRSLKVSLPLVEIYAGVTFRPSVAPVEPE